MSCFKEKCYIKYFDLLSKKRITTFFFRYRLYYKILFLTPRFSLLDFSILDTIKVSYVIKYKSTLNFWKNLSKITYKNPKYCVLFPYLTARINSSANWRKPFLRKWMRSFQNKLLSTTPFERKDPVDTGRKLNVHKTFRRRRGRLLNVLCTFNLRPVSTRNRYFLVYEVLCELLYERSCTKLA